MSKKLYLAPLDDITDSAFRILCKKHGADFMYTEFVAADSLIRDIDKSFRRITFTDFERPIGIQVFGNSVETITKAVKIAEKYNPDEININCGCPVKKIVNKGCGSALLKEPDKLLNIVKEAIKATNIPITIKTRLGWDENNIIIEDLVLKLQDLGVKKVIIHCRTRNQLFSGKANYDYLAKLKSNNHINIEIVGNGDVVDSESYNNMLKTGVDSVMIGRAAIGNPWIFNDLKSGKNDKHSISEIVNVVKEHISLSLNSKNEKETILSLRKHYSKYFKNFPYFKNFKINLMMAKEIKQTINLLNEIHETYS